MNANELHEGQRVWANRDDIDWCTVHTVHHSYGYFSASVTIEAENTGRLYRIESYYLWEGPHFFLREWAIQRGEGDDYVVEELYQAVEGFLSGDRHKCTISRLVEDPVEVRRLVEDYRSYEYWKDIECQMSANKEQDRIQSDLRREIRRSIEEDAKIEAARAGRASEVLFEGEQDIRLPLVTYKERAAERGMTVEEYVLDFWGSGVDENPT